MVSNSPLRGKVAPWTRRVVALTTAALLLSGATAAAQTDPEAQARLAQLRDRLVELRPATSLARAMVLEMQALERRLAQAEAANAVLRARLAAAETARERAERRLAAFPRGRDGAAASPRGGPGSGRSLRPLVQIRLAGILVITLWSPDPEEPRRAARPRARSPRRTVEV